MKKMTGGMGEIVIYVVLFGLCIFLLKLRYSYLTSF
jgi:hypothetical protein